MYIYPIVSQIGGILKGFWRKKLLPKAPDLHTAWKNPECLPVFVQHCPVTQRYLKLLGPINWATFPERDLERRYGQTTIPLASYAAAGLIKLEEGKRSWFQLLQFLVEHPALIWLLGFPLIFSREFPHGFDPKASLPTQRHFTRMLRKIDNQVFQFLLGETVRLIQEEFKDQVFLLPRRFPSIQNISWPG